MESSFPVVSRSRLRARRQELYKARANSAGEGGTGSFNDDDIYGESPSKAPVKDETMEEDALLEAEYEGVVEAWLCTLSERGVMKVSLHRANGV